MYKCEILTKKSYFSVLFVGYMPLIQYFEYKADCFR